MRDQDLVWPFSIKKLRTRWREAKYDGEIGEIATTLFDEVERLRDLLKKTKRRHYEDADFLCAEVMRLRDAIRWLKANLGGGKEYVEQAFKAIGPKHEKELNKLLDKKRKKRKKRA